MTSTTTAARTTVAAHLVRAGNNDRTSFDPKKLEELAASIAAVGILQPPTVRPISPHDHDGCTDDRRCRIHSKARTITPCPCSCHDEQRYVSGKPGPRYELVAGERRFRAMQLLGWSEIPVEIVDDMATDTRRASMAMLVENVQRDDLNPMDEAHAYRSRLDTFGMTVEELADAVGVAPFRIKWRLELLKLRGDVADLVRSGTFPTGFARLMAPLDENRQALAFAAYRDTPRMTCDQFGALCERLALEQASDSMFDDDAFLRVDEYVLDAQTSTTKATRSALLDALGDTLALIGETLGDDSLTETEAARVAHARRLLEMAR